MQRFYSPHIEPHLRSFLLSEEESKHAIRVLRMTVGDELQLVDGRGSLYTAVITDAHPKRAVLEITHVETGYGEKQYHLHIAVAPTKNIERLEWFLEKATEVGIDEVTPLICEHSERKEVKAERLIKVMVAAMKQSLKAYLPRLNQPVACREFLARHSAEDRFIAHCAEGEKQYLNIAAKPGGRYVVLIGPEGDFSAAEIAEAIKQGYAPVTLGDSRLRTETAALMACMEMALLNR